MNFERPTLFHANTDSLREAFKRRNEYAAKVGMGDDGAGRSVFSAGPASMYASPAETQNMRSQHSQNEAAFQNELDKWAGKQGQNNDLYAHQAQEWQRSMAEKEQAMREEQMRAQYGNERAKYQALAGMAGGMGWGGFAPVGGQTSSVDLYDNNGSRIGGSFAGFRQSLLG
jgi:hypothetical protein